MLFIRIIKDYWISKCLLLRGVFEWRSIGINLRSKGKLNILNQTIFNLISGCIFLILNFKSFKFHDNALRSDLVGENPY